MRTHAVPDEQNATTGSGRGRIRRPVIHDTMPRTVVATHRSGWTIRMFGSHYAPWSAVRSKLSGAGPRGYHRDPELRERERRSTGAHALPCLLGGTCAW